MSSIPHVHFSSEIARLYPQVMLMLSANTFGKNWMIGGSVTKEILFRMNDPSYRSTLDLWNLYSAG
jgi:hypothetical protein